MRTVSQAYFLNYCYRILCVYAYIGVSGSENSYWNISYPTIAWDIEQIHIDLLLPPPLKKMLTTISGGEKLLTLPSVHSPIKAISRPIFLFHFWSILFCIMSTLSTCIHFECHVSVCCRLISAVHWLFGREGILFQLCQLCLIPFRAIFTRRIECFHTCLLALKSSKICQRYCFYYFSFPELLAFSSALF